MPNRYDQMSLDVNLDHLEDVPDSVEFSGDVFEDVKTASIESYKKRLSGRKSSVHNGMDGYYELHEANHEPELRALSADFRAIGAGVYEAMSPEWDSGSIWTLYSDDNNSVMLAKITDSTLEDISQDMKVQAATFDLPNKKKHVALTNGTVLTYKRAGDDTLHKGTIIGRDHSAYVVSNNFDQEMDYIPVEAEDDMAQYGFKKKPHNEQAYTSQDPQDAYEYDQQDEDTVGNEQEEIGMTTMASPSELHSNARQAFLNRNFTQFHKVVQNVIASENPCKELILSDIQYDFPKYFEQSFQLLTQ